jgi:hypothetical protein
MATVAGIALGAMFVVAAVSKLSVRGWARSTADALHLPFAITQSTPAVELVIGAGLVTQVRLMRLAGLGLLLIYTGVLLVQVTRATAPPCACFGRAMKPITWWTVGRNVVLIGVALVSLLG